MAIGVLTIHLLLPGCTSLKEKRGRIKPVLARMHREFNVASAEMDLHDRWQESILGVACLSNETAQVQRVLQHVLDDARQHFEDIEIIDHRIELI